MEVIVRLLKKYRAIMIIFIIAIILAVYFRPRTLSDKLGLKDMDPNEIAYCITNDISQGNNGDWFGTASELLGQSNELFGSLLHEVSISGPVFYKNAVINPDLTNLYFAFPKEKGTYQKTTVELILSYGYDSDHYSAFINIDNRGYFVTSGKSEIALFIKKARNIVKDSSSLP